MTNSADPVHSPTIGIQRLGLSENRRVAKPSQLSDSACFVLLQKKSQSPAGRNTTCFISFYSSKMYSVIQPVFSFINFCQFVLHGFTAVDKHSLENEIYIFFLPKTIMLLKQMF